MRTNSHSALALGIALLLGPAEGAYLVEVDIDGADDGVLTYGPDFAFGGDTTEAYQSVKSTAVGLSGGDSIYGGDGVSQPDTYVFTHSPDSQADNLYLAPGAALGDGNFASGAAGGGSGRYAVYTCWPTTSNVNGGLTNYQVETAGDAVTFAIDQNSLGNAWVKLGEVDYLSGPITVTQTPTTNSGVSMRAAGVLFERLDGGSGGDYTGPPGAVIFGEGATSALGLAFKRDRAEALSTHFAVVQGTDLETWSTTDLKLVSITDFDAGHELVTFRAMAPMSAAERMFLAVRATPKMPVGARYCALTYDDGPHPTRTPQLLDLLAERNIRATFYVVGNNAVNHPHILRRMLNEGHEIGNHSMTHAKLTDLTDELVRAEIAGCRDAIVAAATQPRLVSVAGDPPCTIRPPYGAYRDGPRDLSELFLDDFGYPNILWNVDPRDWDSAVTDQQVIDEILTQTDSGEIVLCHDIHQRTIDVMPTVLDGLLGQGFSFVTVSELLRLQGE